MAEQEVGYVEHWWGHPGVAGIKITKGSIKEGDRLHFKGHTTDFEEPVATSQERGQYALSAIGRERGVLKLLAATIRQTATYNLLFVWNRIPGLLVHQSLLSDLPLCLHIGCLYPEF